MRRRRRSSPPISLFSFQDIITSVTGIMILITLLLGLELIQRTVNAPPRKTAEITSKMESAAQDLAREIELLKAELRQQSADLIEAAGASAESLSRELKDLEELNAKLDRELTEAQRAAREAEHRKSLAQAEQDRKKNDAQALAETLREVRRLEDDLRKLRQSNRVVFNPTAGTSKQPWLVEISDQGLTVAAAGQTEKPRSFADAGAFVTWARQRDAAADYFVLLIKPSGIGAFQQARDALLQRKFDVGYDLLTAQQSAIDPETGAAAP